MTTAILITFLREELLSAFVAVPKLIFPGIRTSSLMGYCPVDPEHLTRVTRFPGLKGIGRKPHRITTP
jgi:hypothetical protein